MVLPVRRSSVLSDSRQTGLSVSALVFIQVLTDLYSVCICHHSCFYSDRLPVQVCLVNLSEKHLYNSLTLNTVAVPDFCVSHFTASTIHVSGHQSHIQSSVRTAIPRNSHGRVLLPLFLEKLCQVTPSVFNIWHGGLSTMQELWPATLNDWLKLKSRLPVLVSPD